jgi:hypothetical protein
MITTQQLVFNNKTTNITIKDMVKILTQLHIHALNGGTQNQDNFRILSEHFYNLITMKEIREFIEWHPYVRECKIKVINTCLKRYINFNEARITTDIIHNEQIKVLWFLWENDVYYETYQSISPRIIQLYRVFKFTKYYLEKIFELDYRVGIMRCFRNSDNNDMDYSFSRYYNRSNNPPWINDILNYNEEFKILKPDDYTEFENAEKIKIAINRRKVRRSIQIKYVASSSVTNNTPESTEYNSTESFVSNQVYSNIDINEATASGADYVTSIRTVD